MSILAILFWLVLAVVAIATAALVMPLGITLEAVLDGKLTWNMGLQPFGRFGPTFQIGKADLHAPVVQSEPAKEPAGKTARSWRKPDLRRLPGAFLRLVSELPRAFSLRSLSVDLKFGCADPADTGQVYGMLTPVLFGASGWQRAQFQVEPLFDRAALEGRAKVDVSLVPAKLALPIIRFGWTLFGPRK